MANEFDSLFKGLDSLVKTKTVIGDPMIIDDATIIPIMEVSFGMASGSFAHDSHNAGAMSARMTPVALYVMQKGMGKVKAMCIECIIELGKRMHKQSRRELLNFASPKSIADYYMEQLRHLEQECVYLILLDTKCNILKEIHLSSGTVNSSIVSIRDIFINALNYKASGIILLHNHPSGDPTPSKQDFSITINVKEAGILMNIQKKYIARLKY